MHPDASTQSVDTQFISHVKQSYADYCHSTSNDLSDLFGQVAEKFVAYHAEYLMCKEVEAQRKRRLRPFAGWPESIALVTAWGKEIHVNELQASIEAYDHDLHTLSTYFQMMNAL